MILALALACATGDGGTAAGGPFEAGDYQFYTVAIDDGCLDGALEALFMPEGPATPHPFAYPVYVPGPGELPLTYEVSFREPFVGMTVTVEDGGDGVLVVRDSVIDAVELDPALYGDCVATMTISVTLTPTSPTAGTGQATVRLSDLRGEDGRCPAPTADPCDVALSLELERLGR